jgi:2-polyprenyl-3-methyl-5-hydroxy-6-metoxy-1,4-benzoquinol methylase
MSGDEKRVASLSTDRRGLDELRQKYDEIYESAGVWLYSKSQGIHAVILTQLPPDLSGKRVLDVGCGAGRLSIACARRGAAVTGFDFSEPAIRIAALNAACSGTEVRFEAREIEEFCASATEPFDIVTMVGVLEHVPDPVQTLGSLNRVVAPGGLLVTSSPNFVNLRGFSYMTLLTLLDLPMSLADVRQVDYLAMQDWARATEWRYDRDVGAIYRFGWGEKAATDMSKRLPLAVRDAALGVPFDYARYDEWLRRVTTPAEEMLDWLHRADVLHRIPQSELVPMSRAPGIPDGLWSLMQEYMAEDVTADPYYCETPPFSTMGGEGIYFLEKQ